MKIKTYSGKRMQIIMHQIRQELGPDAIIIAANQDDDGVIVTAALEEPQGIRLHQSQAMQILQAHNVSKNIQAQIIKFDPQLRNNIFQNVINFAPLDIKSVARMVLVGPPGVGKSLATAKLATAALLTGKMVHIITADRGKPGAIEQMRQYAKSINVGYCVIENPLLLRNHLNNLDPNHIVIIDTPGANPFSASDMQYTTALIVAARVAPTLVLSAGMDSDELEDITTMFAAMGAQQVIVTQCDIARRLGGIINILSNNNMQFSAFGSGPGVTDLFIPATGGEFNKLILDKTEALIDNFSWQRAAS